MIPKRTLVRHLRDQYCEILHDGRTHTLWVNPKNRHRCTIPWHRDLPEELIQEICVRLDVPPPDTVADPVHVVAVP